MGRIRDFFKGLFSKSPKLDKAKEEFETSRDYSEEEIIALMEKMNYDRSYSDQVQAYLDYKDGKIKQEEVPDGPFTKDEIMAVLKGDKANGITRSIIDTQTKRKKFERVEDSYASRIVNLEYSDYEDSYKRYLRDKEILKLQPEYKIELDNKKEYDKYRKLDEYEKCIDSISSLVKEEEIHFDEEIKNRTEALKKEREAFRNIRKELESHTKSKEQVANNDFLRMYINGAVKTNIKYNKIMTTEQRRERMKKSNSNSEEISH